MDTGRGPRHCSKTAGQVSHRPGVAATRHILEVGGGEGRHLKRCYLGCKHYPELRATATEAPSRRRLPGVPSLSSERGERFIPPEENPERSFQVQPREDSQNRTPATSSVLRTRSSPGGLRSCARDRNRSRVSNTGTCSLRSRSPDPV